MSKRTIAFIRFAGALLALASLSGAACVIAKLYTGRGEATPVRAAIYEQPLVGLFGLAGAAIGVANALVAEPD